MQRYLLVKADPPHPTRDTENNTGGAHYAASPVGTATALLLVLGATATAYKIRKGAKK